MRFCFMDIIAQELETIMMDWNQHRVRRIPASACPQGIPELLYNVPELYGKFSCNNRFVNFSCTDHVTFSSCGGM